MKVTIIQTKLFWEDRDKNLEHFNSLIDKINEPTDLIVLPEMFTTGFSMSPEKIAEQHLSTSYNWLLKIAKEKNAIITGSIATKEDGNFFNRLHWVEPNGNSSFYDKRHLFRMAKEDEKYTAGKEKIIKTFGDWKIMPLVCYDLRFPVWSRNFKNHKATYDVLIYVANWPEVRNYPWKQLLIARAIENQCYVIGVNRIGKDGNDFNHSGDSMVINPRGEIISKTKANEESIETISLDKIYLEEFRKLFPVALDSDDFELK
ncbi:MAG: amidohydrolase [Bacteroidota bacterium]|nr:amidohydrolase [Bacteroidota bacterium]